MQSRQSGSTLSFPGCEDARRRQLPTGRKLLTTRKTRGTTTTMRRRRISVLLTIDDDRTLSPRSAKQVLPPGRRKLIDYVSVHALRSQPSCFIATSVMCMRTETGASFVPDVIDMRQCQWVGYTWGYSNTEQTVVVHSSLMSRDFIEHPRSGVIYNFVGVLYTVCSLYACKR